MKNLGTYLMAITCLLLTTATAHAQVTAPNNQPNGTNYVGFDANSDDPLPIRNDGDPRIHISSNLLRKITIDELPVWNGLNGLSESNFHHAASNHMG